MAKKVKSQKPVDEPIEDEVLDEVADAPEETEDTEVESQETEQEAPPSFLSKLGDDYASLDEDAALARFQQERAEAQQLRQQTQHYAWQLQQLQQQQEQSQRQAQQYQQQQVQQQAAEKKAWKAPEYDPRWLALVERNEKGQLVPVPGADPTLPQKIQNYADWKAQNEQKFWADPGGFVHEQLQDRIATMVQEQATQAIQQYHRDREISDWEKANSQWFYGANGQITAEGQMVIKYANDFLGGKAGGAAGLDLARKAVYGELVARQQVTPAQANGNKKMDLLRNGAQRKINRDGQRDRPDRKTPLSNLPLEHRFKKALEEEGIELNDVDALMAP